eukprot:gene35236-47356_t
MQLTLEGISKKVGPEPWLYEMGIAPKPGAVTVLLGATQAGKTSLMRIMAGLDTPTTGRVTAAEGGVKLSGGVHVPLTMPAAAAGALTLGARAGALRLQPREGDVALTGQVELAEISGSDTYVHAKTPVGELVAQLTGVHVAMCSTRPARCYWRLRVPPREPEAMSRIDLDLAHSYKPDPKEDTDYALLPLKMSFEDGGAY